MPVSTCASSRVALTIQQNDLFPEGLAADPTRALFYMGSAHHNKIVQFQRVANQWILPPRMHTACSPLMG
jgi:hypothetical protein